MMRKSIICVLAAATLLTAGVQSTFAQRSEKDNAAADPVQKLGYEKKLRWADGLFKDGSYYNAVDYYLQLMQEQPRNPYLAHQVAVSYDYLRDYANAAKYYGYAFDLSSILYPKDLYNNALMLKMNGDYDEAQAKFQKFINDNPRPREKEIKDLKKRAQLEIDGIAMGRSSMNNPEAATVKNLGPNVNTGYTQLSPYPLGDTAILFGTQNINQLAVTDKVPREEYMSKLMVSRKQKYTDVVDTFEWPLPFNDGKYNNPNFHVGNGAFAPGGDQFFFTRCIDEDSNRQVCRILYSTFENDRWSEPREMENNINVDGSSSTNPYMAKVGKNFVLFFASNRELQSRGGFDIWYSIYDTRQKTFRRPQNAGKQINTIGDEKTPYYDDRTGTLYFSSNGWKSLGGYDIYSAQVNGGRPSRYTNLQNLGFPINTSYDDFYYVLDPYGKPDGYLVSNRPGSISIKNPTCCDDIWRVQYEPKIIVNGVVLNSKTQQKVGNVVVKMVDDAGNVKTFNSEDGNFQFNATRNHSYVLNADKQNHISTRATFSTMGMKREEPNRTVNLTIYVDSFYIDQSFAMNNIYYDYDKATLRPESGAELEKLIRLLNDNPSLDVEIMAHTDSKGTDAYNQNLSRERAQSVVNYLVSSGISNSRFSASGLGEKQPAAPNTTASGKDNPEGRQLNRRTEFKITADQPTRRLIYDSSKKGTIGEQERNLQIQENEQVGENYEYNTDGTRIEPDMDGNDGGVPKERPATPASPDPAQTNSGANEMSSDVN